MAADAPAGELVDPFAFFAGVSSRIAGLGGDATGHEPAYAFHTPYVRVAPGPAHFTIRFDQLNARHGTLVVRIHMLPLDHSAHARLINSERVPLPRLARQGGTIRIGFESFKGMSFAVLGLIFDDTDATAQALTVNLDRPYDGSDEAVEPVQKTRYGHELAGTSQMVSREPPTLLAPVSQLSTVAQFAEAPFVQARALEGGEPAEARMLWQQVYVLQTLRVYGLLQSGARGIGLGGDHGFLVAALAAAGISVTLVDREAPDLDRLRRPEMGDAASFDAMVTAVQADPAELPGQFEGFDFAWSCGTASRLGEPGAGLRFVEDTIRCLHPGGIAVNVFDFALAPDLDPGGAIAFSPSQIERLALSLISRRHEVAQLRMFDPRQGGRGGPAARASFGLIARREGSG